MASEYFHMSLTLKFPQLCPSTSENKATVVGEILLGPLNMRESLIIHNVSHYE